MASISSISLFPIKSFDGVDVPAAELRPNGSLRHDREYKFVEADGNGVDSLSPDPKLYQVRVTFDAACRHAHFSMPGMDELSPADFDLQTQAAEVGEWMSRALGRAVRLVRDDAHGFCDDQEFAGPTVISQATLDRVAETSGHADVPRRLRANIVLDGMKAFEEDGLSKSAGFTLGDGAFFRRVAVHSVRGTGARSADRRLRPVF